MKVILSRKGFDSLNGGISSPIFEDGTMLSFPIPSNDGDTYDDLQYCGTLYSSILEDLHYKGDKYCHIDPDLDLNRRVKSIDKWKAAFGQIEAAATYLKNIGIKKGDLFLFFGNFHQVVKRNGHYSYVKRTGDFYKDQDLQVIWGYMQVGEIIEDPREQEKYWWHPHSNVYRRCERTNVIFTASERLSFDDSKPGAGVLPFDIKRVLTLEHSNKATWKKKTIYDIDHILCKRKNSASDPDKGIYYAGIWQELGLKESEECTDWAESIIL